MATDSERWLELKEKERLLKQAADAISVQEKDLPRVIARFKRELEEFEKAGEELKPKGFPNLAKKR